MNLNEALEMLGAPDNVKFNILAKERWLKSKDRLLRLVSLMEWLRDTLDRSNAETARSIKRLENCKNTQQTQLTLMQEIEQALPKRLNEMVTREEAKVAATKAYAAGYAAAVVTVFSDSEDEIAKLRQRNAAIKLVASEITGIQEFVRENALVDKNGNILAE